MRDDAFVKLYRAVLRSDAWRSASINARRVIDFLMLEHMDHGGKGNGKLKAPHRQLEDFGIGARYIAGAVREAEELGLVDCHRGGMRVATTYALTWLPLHDGKPAGNRWCAFSNPKLRPLRAPKSKNLPSEGKAALPSEGKADRPNLPSEGKADRPKNLPSEGKALLRKVLPGRGHRLGVSTGEAPPEGDGPAPSEGFDGDPKVVRLAMGTPGGSV
jgi:hypothetical protein